MRLTLTIALGLTVLACRSIDADDEQLDIVQRRTAMTRQIDERLQEKWRDAGFTEAARANDEEFLRRIYLDLCGVIPRVSEAREFLQDRGENKRELLVERLLASPAHSTHMATTWRNIMLPGGVDLEQIQNAVGVQNWLRKQFADNVRYDRMVSELLVATSGSDAGPALFYTAQELQPEKLAAATARIFLGLQIECAQCHNHPFDHWKQDDFWGYAAFFARIKQARTNRTMARVRLEDVASGEVMIPNSERVIGPKFPGGDTPIDRGTRREQLSIWMASRDNPYLARAAVNRTWAHFFGRGLVDPVDDLSTHNVPSHPELLESLTRYFVEIGFDLRELGRTLVATEAYQLSSAWEAAVEPPAELFLRMQLKPLSPEQLYDSLSRLFGNQDAESMPGIPGATGPFAPRRLSFIGRLQSPSRQSIEYQAGVLQALTLLNGSDVQAASGAEQSSLVGALTSPLFGEQERTDIIFLATLSRRPRADERELAQQYFRSSGTTTDPKQAASDLVWAILNGAEFAMNH